MATQPRKRRKSTPARRRTNKAKKPARARLISRPAARSHRSASASASTAPRRPRTLCVDIGGSGVKAMVLDPQGQAVSERLRVKTPRPATPGTLLRAVTALARQLGPFERASVGFPGVVIDGVTKSAPNLHPSWAGFRLAEHLSRRWHKPVRALNDAGMQGHAVIEGRGLEMVLTLGTGMGCALFIDGRYVPNLELAHHPFRHEYTYEQYIGEAAIEEFGRKRWNVHLARVIAQVMPIFNPRKIYIGGGNAKHVHHALPSNVEITRNIAGLYGGIALWRDRDEARAVRGAKGRRR